jgi:hypothetical protein
MQGFLMQTRSVLLLLLFCTAVHAQSDLREQLKDTDIAAHWIYDDLPQAIQQAKATGKPLLVVLRCVPCPPGRTLDTQVMQPQGDLEALEKNFVCVRIVQTKGLDLKLFQYDYDMSWAAMFLNADGTIYGRYGTRTASGPGSDSHISLPSFRKAVERALELHKNYPANRAQLAGKLGGEPQYARPEHIPGLEQRAQGASTRQNCIHCHMVREYALRAKWQAGKLSLADLQVYPLPDNVGMQVDIDDGLLIKSVKRGSPAAEAGLAAGDHLLSLGGQSLISLADIQWVLHTSPTEAEIKATLRRDGQTLEKTIVVSGDWKQSDIAWRASSWYGLRQGLKLEPLPAAEKSSRGLSNEAMALAIKGLFGQGGQKLQKAGLKVGDVLIAVDGKSQAMTESEFLIDLRLRHGPEDAVKLTFLRGDERKELSVPMW